MCNKQFSLLTLKLRWVCLLWRPLVFYCYYYNFVNEVDVGYTSKRTFCLLSTSVLQCEWYPSAAPTQLHEVLKWKIKSITSVRQSLPNKFCSELCMDWLTTVYIFGWHLYTNYFSKCHCNINLWSPSPILIMLCLPSNADQTLPSNSSCTIGSKTSLNSSHSQCMKQMVI